MSFPFFYRSSFLEKALDIFYEPIYKEPSQLTRGGEAWYLVGLITRRPQVQILPPLPNLLKPFS